MGPKIKVTTQHNESMIYQNIDMEIGDRSQQLARYVMDLSNEQVKQALIEMGWTPPPDEPKKPKAGG